MTLSNTINPVYSTLCINCIKISINRFIDDLWCNIIFFCFSLTMSELQNGSLVGITCIELICIYQILLDINGYVIIEYWWQVSVMMRFSQFVLIVKLGLIILAAGHICTIVLSIVCILTAHWFSTLLSNVLMMDVLCHIVVNKTVHSINVSIHRSIPWYQDYR